MDDILHEAIAAIEAEINLLKAHGPRAFLDWSALDAAVRAAKGEPTEPTEPTEPAAEVQAEVQPEPVAEVQPEASAPGVEVGDVAASEPSDAPAEPTAS